MLTDALKEWQDAIVAISEQKNGAIESDVLQAQGPKGDPIVELLSGQKPLEPEFAAVMQQCLDETLSEAPDAVLQPPAPCQKCAELETERMRLAACAVVALANTPESAKAARAMMPEYESASCHEVAMAVDREMALRAEVERLTTYKTDAYAALQKKNDELDTLQSTIAQQVERIAELEAQNDELCRKYQEHAGAKYALQDTLKEKAALIEKCRGFLMTVRWPTEAPNEISLDKVRLKDVCTALGFFPPAQTPSTTDTRDAYEQITDFSEGTYHGT